HHKNNTKKYYDLAKKHIDKKYLQEKDPNQTLKDYYKGYVYRRIKGIGMVYNLSSDAWLGIRGLKAKQRREAIKGLLDERKLKEYFIKKLGRKVYITTEDARLLSNIDDIKLNNRVEFLAPLDNLLGDRNLVFDLFNFHYRWDVYTPSKKREYGYYVLPVLYEDSFIGRIEIVSNKKKDRMKVKNYWWSMELKIKKKLVKLIYERLERFASFNQCSEIEVNSKKIIG
ncbi:MAG: DNA glycosylase AlkZ-like family protein, partial [Halanaerobiales bacterium]